eukprot:CAMPEP_0202029274 /NCGR_PEP_ID=MMETSP0905-20130828/63889_1 /ASSEMBLY_ACC=CAM_ASM_000554 /TAXON_ID=420261 /ORGANISM="Thalassiosira antarctica, Strain CCMP982" /LENGTH=280 /DNA_ID=CAMNT_0048593021 /DNA_START=27 /DNA_END=866 /DNA_ORIENTATION=+
MNRLIQTASKSVASSLRINNATPSSSAVAVQFLTARHLSDSTHNAQRELADRGYIKSKSSLSLDEKEEEHIQQHVDKRAQAKKDQNLGWAGKIRLDLKKGFDVTINDTQKLWSIGGLFAEFGGNPKGFYTRRGGGDLSAEDEEAISKMILDRYHAKKEKFVAEDEDAISKMILDRYHAKRERNYDAADEIRDALMSTYSVKVDDRSEEWRVETDDYAMVRDNTLSDEDVEYIDSKLKERSIFKRERIYKDADAIRDDLSERFGVKVDDRTKEWFVDSGFG